MTLTIDWQDIRQRFIEGHSVTILADEVGYDPHHFYKVLQWRFADYDDMVQQRYNNTHADYNRAAFLYSTGHYTLRQTAREVGVNSHSLIRHHVRIILGEERYVEIAAQRRKRGVNR